MIDKVAGMGRPVIARTGDLAHLAELAEAIAPRESAGPDRTMPARTPLRLPILAKAGRMAISPLPDRAAGKAG
ncbi:hypothetical protein WAC47_28350, partial [Klebsiella pneumoniae]